MTQVTDETPRTGWFSTATPPVHPGWYECRYGDADRLPWIKLVWDGRNWRNARGGVAMFGTTPDDVAYLWRGLVNDIRVPHEIALGLDDLLKVL